MRSPLIAMSLFAAVSPTIVAAAPQSPRFNNDGFAQPRNTEVKLPQRFAVPRSEDPLTGLGINNAAVSRPVGAAARPDRLVKTAAFTGATQPLSAITEDNTQFQGAALQEDATRRPAGERPERPVRVPYTPSEGNPAREAGVPSRPVKVPDAPTYPEREPSTGRPPSSGPRPNNGDTGTGTGETGTGTGTDSGTDDGLDGATGEAGDAMNGVTEPGDSSDDNSSSGNESTAPAGDSAGEQEGAGETGGDATGAGEAEQTNGDDNEDSGNTDASDMTEALPPV
ncbi:hypothetical protein C8Q76DRAFT_690050 [Earliella scabrosa]|nr:hypothetical protein C8Q76DRAFT_690050 [Earliella scabrosa]